MKLSARAKYGLNACYYIAISNEIISVQNLADKMKVSNGYLEQIIGILKKHKIIEAQRGAQGGYFLTRKPNEITVGEIVRPLEDDFKLTDCVVGECSGNCPSKIVWQKLYEGINIVLDNITLQDLIINGGKK